MTRRTAVQSLLAVIVGAMENQTTTTGTLHLAEWNKPRSLLIDLHWKDITVVRHGERVTLDQDELFKALKGDK